MITPILMLGAGRMGGAMIEGWLAAKAFAGSELVVRDPQPGPAALAAQAAGAALNPPDAELARARTVVLAVKPQMWREAAAEAAPWLHADAVIVSIAAGVKSRDIAKEFGGRCVARVMPTTAAAIGQGTASLYADDPAALARAQGFEQGVGAVVDLTDEGLMHAATAVSGSAPAELRRQVTSPGGTTQAALDVLLAADGLPGLLREAVAAAVRRSKELGV